MVCLIASCDGLIAAEPLRALRSLPTYRCGSVAALAPGTPVRRTVDLFTSPGYLYLVADTAEELGRIAVGHSGWWGWLAQYAVDPVFIPGLLVYRLQAQCAQSGPWKRCMGGIAARL